MRTISGIGLGLVALLALAPGAAFAATGKPGDLRSGFIKSCQTQMYMTAAQCGCMADKAQAQLDDQAIAYLSLPALDVGHSTSMAKAMSGAERNKIDAFMKNAPHQCAGAK